jgi:hypothetical protein
MMGYVECTITDEENRLVAKAARAQAVEFCRKNCLDVAKRFFRFGVPDGI